MARRDDASSRAFSVPFNITLPAQMFFKLKSGLVSGKVLIKSRHFQDGNFVNSMTTVLAGQISFCLVAIARQSLINPASQTDYIR